MSETVAEPRPLERLKELTEQLVGPELFYRLIESLPDALVVVNGDGNVVLFNAQAEFLFGYHRSEVVGGKVEALIPEAVAGRHVQHREGFMREPRTRAMGVGMTLAARHKDGHEIPVLINLSPIVSTDGMFVSAVIRRK